MDIVDEFPKTKGYFIVMDNAPIHVPELNQIEQFWATLKDKVGQNKLNDIKMLFSRIIGASKAVPIDHLQNIIQHSINQFGNCRNKVAI
ncbi:hypothetical protein CU098_003949 [Rhizopus stolonifer]|uniref:Tc1-like transposase DDE domain-containing protein n=1 Tax=Rhizopus stolonifer TaxID=4846 RepID=A0A367KPD4_RHIST|nr:hypothetical protein CU098_003949 [Rhizopus stolonifer]